MASESLLANRKLGRRGLVEQMTAHGWNWRAAGAVFGLSCGIIAPLIGSVLTAIAWFTAPEWHGLSFHRGGTILLFLTIPLLIFGAHCLDLMEKQDEDTNGLRIEERKNNDLVRD